MHALFFGEIKKMLSNKKVNLRKIKGAYEKVHIRQVL
jgi:hypothetical protein